MNKCIFFLFLLGILSINCYCNDISQNHISVINDTVTMEYNPRSVLTKLLIHEHANLNVNNYMQSIKDVMSYKTNDPSVEATKARYVIDVAKIFGDDRLAKSYIDLLYDIGDVRYIYPGDPHVFNGKESSLIARADAMIKKIEYADKSRNTAEVISLTDKFMKSYKTVSYDKGIYEGVYISSVENYGYDVFLFTKKYSTFNLPILNESNIDKIIITITNSFANNDIDAFVSTIIKSKDGNILIGDDGGEGYISKEDIDFKLKAKEGYFTHMFAYYQKQINNYYSGKYSVRLEDNGKKAIVLLAMKNKGKEIAIPLSLILNNINGYWKLTGILLYKM